MNAVWADHRARLLWRVLLEFDGELHDRVREVVTVCPAPAISAEED